MKSNDFRDLYDNVCSKEVRLVFCEIRCFKKLDPDVSTVYSNNESEIPAQKRPELGERSFSCANGHK